MSPRLVHASAGVRFELFEAAVVARFDAPCRVLSFAPERGGFATAPGVAIVGVRNADLPIGRDPLELLRTRLAPLGDDLVGMMTSRSLHEVDAAEVRFEGLGACALATVGLSNAVLVGDTPGPLAGWGTVNVVVHVDRPLTDAGLVEMLSVVAEARTVAILEADVASRRSGARASGTGTDCISVACPLAPPPGEPPEVYAGKHTAVGHVVGAAALAALRAGIARWTEETRA